MTEMAEHRIDPDSRARADAGPVTGGTPHGAEEPPVQWLTAAEVESWLSVVRLMTWLPWSVDQQLRRDSNLGMVEYQVLAMLSESRNGPCG